MLTLTVPVYKRWLSLLTCFLLWGLPIVGWTKEPYRVLSQINDDIAAQEAQPRPGAPQVLEIPPVRDVLSPSPSLPSSSTSLSNQAPMGAEEYNQKQHFPPTETVKRSYLGLVYVSVEEEDGGVEVLDVLVGSPAAQAGFIGARTPVPSSRTEQLMKFAVAGLAMSPAAYAAVPLVIAHQLFMACHPRGDVILAVGDQAIRDAAELNDEIRRYHPGEQIEFSVVRCGKPVQITAQIGEEDAAFSDEEEAQMQNQQSEQPTQMGGASFLFRSFP